MANTHLPSPTFHHYVWGQAQEPPSRLNTFHCQADLNILNSLAQESPSWLSDFTNMCLWSFARFLIKITIKKVFQRFYSIFTCFVFVCLHASPLLFPLRSTIIRDFTLTFLVAIGFVLSCLFVLLFMIGDFFFMTCMCTPFSGYIPLCSAKEINKCMYIKSNYSQLRESWIPQDWVKRVALRGSYLMVFIATVLRNVFDRRWFQSCDFDFCGVDCKCINY